MAQNLTTSEQSLAVNILLSYGTLPRPDYAVLAELGGYKNATVAASAFSKFKKKLMNSHSAADQQDPSSATPLTATAATQSPTPRRGRPRKTTLPGATDTKGPGRGRGKKRAGAAAAGMGHDDEPLAAGKGADGVVGNVEGVSKQDVDDNSGENDEENEDWPAKKKAKSSIKQEEGLEDEGGDHVGGNKQEDGGEGQDDEETGASGGHQFQSQGFTPINGTPAAEQSSQHDVVNKDGHDHLPISSDVHGPQSEGNLHKEQVGEVDGLNGHPTSSNYEGVGVDVDDSLLSGAIAYLKEHSK